MKRQTAQFDKTPAEVGRVMRENVIAVRREWGDILQLENDIVDNDRIRQEYSF